MEKIEKNGKSTSYALLNLRQRGKFSVKMKFGIIIVLIYSIYLGYLCSATEKNVFF